MVLRSYYSSYLLKKTFSVNVILRLNLAERFVFDRVGGRISIQVSGPNSCPPEHLYPNYSVHNPLQPSPSKILPSSQSLMPKFLESPQTYRQVFYPDGGERNP